jgi:hypothetical protein
MYPTRKVITLTFYLGLLTQCCMKYVILKYLFSKLIQDIVEKKDLVQIKALSWNDIEIFQSGKFCTAQYSEDDPIKIFEKLKDFSIPK